MKTHDESPMLEAGVSQIGNLLQFLAWIAERPRTYAQTLDAWRSSCPRLSAWEDATANGLVDLSPSGDDPQAQPVVVLTPKGRKMLSLTCKPPAV
ncbi:hypothetical protein QEP16_15285 [Achromobacter insolitus]|uniref:hypothetical protein n=1 Tax=Achromobacter insolitus TaxID=217204 RepID=UPI0009EEF835|nr:hypothetical protein [Achromobacter insolitus]MDH3064688.1 hypothetical protein [Achromobacter insolitus]GLK93607.1 hypothetical protein GCM10008164_13440 [Achromobacter xylosoxidans]